MKKALCAVMVLLLMGAVALAGAPKLSSSLFDRAKEALASLAAGDYEALSDNLPFSENAPDSSEWKRLAEKYADLSFVQSDYAVAFWTGSIWVVAVPVQAPSDGSVEALAFSSEDGVQFNACRYASRWKRPWATAAGSYGTGNTSGIPRPSSRTELICRKRERTSLPALFCVFRAYQSSSSSSSGSSASW